MTDLVIIRGLAWAWIDCVRRLWSCGCGLHCWLGFREPPLLRPTGSWREGNGGDPQGRAPQTLRSCAPQVVSRILAGHPTCPQEGRPPACAGRLPPVSSQTSFCDSDPLTHTSWLPGILGHVFSVLTFPTGRNWNITPHTQGCMTSRPRVKPRTPQLTLTEEETVNETSKHRAG